MQLDNYIARRPSAGNRIAAVWATHIPTRSKIVKENIDFIVAVLIGGLILLILLVLPIK